MGNICCRRETYSPNGDDIFENGRCAKGGAMPPPLQTQTTSTAYHSAGDDCAINELLEGRMELDVVLPDGRTVRLTVERRTPMMDLLVQAASATKISPGGHVIHVFGDNGREGVAIQYKPSTPIGSLDTKTICIVPKKELVEPPSKRTQRSNARPFEPTFRVQVHLPRNQLTVVRVSPRIKINELRNMVCQEKGLDIDRYQLVQPSDPTHPLDGDLTLAEYGATEISLLSNSCIESHICNSTSHIIPYSKRIEEKKKTGILRLLAEDISNTKTKHYNKLKPEAPMPLDTNHPKAPTRFKPKKRRPAPLPPPAPFHSRQSSSDSSGYHEVASSFLHEEEQSSHRFSDAEKASSDSSGVSSLNAVIPTTTFVAPVSQQGGKKRKAPPPPPIMGGTEEMTLHPETGEVVEQGSVEDKGATSCDETPSDTSGSDLSPDRDLEELSPETVTKITALSSFENFRASLNERDKARRNLPSFDSIDAKLPKKDEDGCPTVTRVALAALNARIEQDVTKQEIASSIEAAFCSLDRPRKKERPRVDGRTNAERPSLLAIKQRRGPLQTEVLDRGGEVPSQNSEVNELPPVKVHANDRPVTHPPVEPVLKTIPETAKAVVSYAQYEPLKRSSSLLSLVESKKHAEKTATETVTPVKSLQRSLSQLNGTVDDKQQEFEAEQDRLHREYVKLQKQFVLWQKQLLNNHAMLREERIVPQYARTLRQSHSLPDGVPESAPHQSNYDAQIAQDRSPLVSRSYSYEPTKDKSCTLPRSTINITSLEMGTLQMDGSSTLRSSKTKSYFKPPQVRMSTISRQRLPPEIRKEGDIDICDDMKMLSTILPSFESLKLITEGKENHSREEVPVPKSTKDIKNPVDCKRVDLQSHKKCTPKVTLSTSIPNKQAIAANHDKLFKAESVVNQKTVLEKIVNGHPKQLIEESKAVVTLGPMPPPPPPMPTYSVVPNGSIQSVSKQSVGLKNVSVPKSKVPAVDSREALMLEIRKFGGRTSLRKISLTSS